MSRLRGILGRVSDAAHDRVETPNGMTKFARDLSAEQLAAAPSLASIDALVIEDLSDDEDDAFSAALAS